MNEQHTGNVCKPNLFGRSDPTKLWTFFSQLELVFKACPRTFDTDEKKVTYAVSDLKGITLGWFEPFLLEPAFGNPVLFLSDYSVFQEELRANLGPYNIVGDGPTLSTSMIRRCDGPTERARGESNGRGMERVCRRGRGVDTSVCPVVLNGACRQMGESCKESERVLRVGYERCKSEKRETRRDD